MSSWSPTFNITSFRLIPGERSGAPFSPDNSPLARAHRHYRSLGEHLGGFDNGIHLAMFIDFIAVISSPINLNNVTSLKYFGHGKVGI